MTAAGGGQVVVRLHLWGRVQGVGFRYFARGEARHLGLVGRVRNLPGGEVEVDVAGDEQQVEQFKARLQQGPPGAMVAGLREELLSREGGEGGEGGASAWDRFEIDR